MPPTCLTEPESVTGLARLKITEASKKIGPDSVPPAAELSTAPPPEIPVPAIQMVFGMAPWTSSADVLVVITNVWAAEMPSGLTPPSVRVPAVTATLPVKVALVLLNVTELLDTPVIRRLPPPESWPTSSSLITAEVPRLSSPPLVPTENCLVLRFGLKVPELSWNLPPLRMIWRAAPAAPSGPVAGSAPL